MIALLLQQDAVKQMPLLFIKSPISTPTLALKLRRMSKAKEAWELELGSRSALDRKEGGKRLLNNPAWAMAPPPIRRPPRA
jgi:hypothetical protein